MARKDKHLSDEVVVVLAATGGMGLEPGVLLDVSEHPLHKIALLVDVTVVRSRQFGNRDASVGRNDPCEEVSGRGVVGVAEAEVRAGAIKHPRNVCIHVFLDHCVIHAWRVPPGTCHHFTCPIYIDIEDGGVPPVGGLVHPQHLFQERSWGARHFNIGAVGNSRA